MTAPLSHPKVLFLEPDTWAEWQKYIRSDSQRKGKAFWNGLHYSTWQDSGMGPVFWIEPWTFGGLQGRRGVSCDGNMKYDRCLEFDRKQRGAKCKQEDSDERKQADEKGSIESSTLCVQCVLRGLRALMCTTGVLFLGRVQVPLSAARCESVCIRALSWLVHLCV